MSSWTVDKCTILVLTGVLVFVVSLMIASKGAADRAMARCERSQHILRAQSEQKIYPTLTWEEAWARTQPR